MELTKNDILDLQLAMGFKEEVTVKSETLKELIRVWEHAQGEAQRTRDLENQSAEHASNSETYRNTILSAIRALEGVDNPPERALEILKGVDLWATYSIFR